MTMEALKGKVSSATRPRLNPAYSRPHTLHYEHARQPTHHLPVVPGLAHRQQHELPLCSYVRVPTTVEPGPLGLPQGTEKKTRGGNKERATTVRVRPSRTVYTLTQRRKMAEIIMLSS